MTAYSQNGFVADNPRLIRTYTIPDTAHVRIAMRAGSVATVLSYVAARFDNEVQRLHPGWCWGFAERVIRGGSQLSNHASGTAIDLNAPLHPLGSNPHSNYTASQIAAIHRILAACNGVVRWGGDYSGRKDGMHFEINSTLAATVTLASKIKGVGSDGKPHLSRYLRVGSTGLAVYNLQKALNAQLTKYELQLDGKFGPKTEAAVKQFQKDKHLPQDGVVGPNTARALGWDWVG